MLFILHETLSNVICDKKSANKLYSYGLATFGAILIQDFVLTSHATSLVNIVELQILGADLVPRVHSPPLLQRTELIPAGTSIVVGKLSFIRPPSRTATGVACEGGASNLLLLPAAVLVMPTRGSPAAEAVRGRAARQAEAGQVGSQQRLEAHGASADDTEVDLDDAPDTKDGLSVRDVGGGANHYDVG